MDVNNTPFMLLRDEADFAQGSIKLRWNRAVRALTLAQNQSLRLPASEAAAALDAWEVATPLALDGFNQVGCLSDDLRTVQCNGGRGFATLQDRELADVAAPVGVFTDMALGGSGRLALPYTDNAGLHGLVLFHLARRWQTSCDLSRDREGAPLPPPRRACVDAEDRVWLVSTTRLLLACGEPLPLPYTPQPARFEPEPLNPHALELSFAQPLPAGWKALALCCDEETLYILVHNGAGAQAILTRPLSLSPDAAFVLHACEEDVPFVIDLALATDRMEGMAQERPSDSSFPVPGRLAALAPREPGDSGFVRRDAVILELLREPKATTGRAVLVRERYPMLSLAVPRFVTSADGQLRYQAEADPDFPDIAPRPRELHALRRPRYYADGKAMLQHIFDSGQPGTDWHRLYLDARIPAGCAIKIAARVFDSMKKYGKLPAIPQLPPLWSPLSSELPFADALAGYEPGTSGLFEILLQRQDGPVRRLSGRYLQLEVTLCSNGRETPCLHAIRVYYPRFSYQEAYLPEFYRQERRFDPAASGSANGPDTRERLLSAFEGLLTPIEGRIAASAQLAHPDAAPAGHLPWLAEVLGMTLPARWPTSRQRRLVREGTLVQQFRGTLYGVQLALDIASDGGVQRGEIVLVENFRLRRTMATILGVSMDDADHPLTLGTGMSGNSIVGESLILSEADAREFLALFAPELATREEAAQVKAFFEKYAHQITVLLHNRPDGGRVAGASVGAGATGRGRVQRSTVDEVLAREMPAHLVWRVFETEHPFVLGTSPLLTVDTFIETSPEFRRVRLDDTSLGREGVLKNPAAFSPADINARSS